MRPLRPSKERAKEPGSALSTDAPSLPTLMTPVVRLAPERPSGFRTCGLRSWLIQDPKRPVRILAQRVVLLADRDADTELPVGAERLSEGCGSDGHGSASLEKTAARPSEGGKNRGERATESARETTPSLHDSRRAAIAPANPSNRATAAARGAPTAGRLRHRLSSARRRRVPGSACAGLSAGAGRTARSSVICSASRREAALGLSGEPPPNAVHALSSRGSDCPSPRLDNFTWMKCALSGALCVSFALTARSRLNAEQRPKAPRLRRSHPDRADALSCRPLPP